MSCERCADPTTYDRLEQLSTDVERHSLLVRCPDCGSLHEVFPEEKHPARRLTPLEARRLYPGVHALLRPAGAADQGSPRQRVRRLPGTGREPDAEGLVRRLEQAGFTVVRDRRDGTGNRLVELHSPGLDVRLVADRGQWRVDVGDATRDDWRSLDPEPDGSLEGQVEHVVTHRAELARPSRGDDPRPWPDWIRYPMIAVLFAVVGIGLVTVLYDKGFLPIAGPFVLLFLLPLLVPLRIRGLRNRSRRLAGPGRDEPQR